MYTLLNEGVIANVGCALIRRADLEKLTEKCSVMFSYELYRESSSNRINVLQWIVNDGRGFRLFRCFWPFVAGHAWRDAYARPQLVLLKRGDWNRQNCRTNSRVVQNQLAGWRSAHSGDCFFFKFQSRNGVFCCTRTHYFYGSYSWYWIDLKKYPYLHQSQDRHRAKMWWSCQRGPLVVTLFAYNSQHLGSVLSNASTVSRPAAHVLK